MKNILDIHKFMNKKVRIEWKTPYGKPTKRKAVGELRWGNNGKLHLHISGFYYIIEVEDVLLIKVVEK